LARASLLARLGSAPRRPHGQCRRELGQVDDYAAWRLKRLLMPRHGRSLRPSQTNLWTRGLLPRSRSPSPAERSPRSRGV